MSISTIELNTSEHQLKLLYESFSKHKAELQDQFDEMRTDLINQITAAGLPTIRDSVEEQYKNL